MSYFGLLSQIIAKKHLKSDIFYELLVISNSQHLKINKRIVSFNGQSGLFLNLLSRFYSILPFPFYVYPLSSKRPFSDHYLD